MGGLSYPDGGAYLDQPVLLLDALRTIGSARASLRRDADT